MATLVFYFTAQNRTVLAATMNTLLTGCVLYVFVDISKDTGHRASFRRAVGIFVGGILGMELKKRLEKNHGIGH